jgi:DNA polymerase-3 subunit delta
MPAKSRRLRGGTSSRAKAIAGDIYAVIGSDESEVKRFAAELAARLAPKDAGEFGNDVIDGVAENSDQAAARIHQTIEAVNTFPFFGGEKLVWLKSANFFGSNVMGKSIAVTGAAEQLIDLIASGVPEGVRLLISAIDVDKTRRFYKQLSKVAKVEIYDKLDAGRAGWEEKAEIMIRARSREFGLGFTGEALEIFTQFTGGDSRLIVSELEKLDLYLGDRRTIEADDVRVLVPISRQGVIFELGNAVAERNIQRCLDLLDQLLRQGESAIGILLVAIFPTIRNLLLVKDIMQRFRIRPPAELRFFLGSLNRLPDHATRHLPRKKDGTINGYALGVAATHAHHHNVDELRKMIDACLHANLQLVSTQLDARVVLSQLIGRLAPPQDANRHQKKVHGV